MSDALHITETAIKLAKRLEECPDRGERALVLAAACELHGASIINTAIFLVLVEQGRA